MKLTVCLSASLVALLALTGSVRAHSPGDDEPDNPYADSDPDGVPLAVTHPQETMTPAQIAAAQKDADDAARNRDWLLNGYEEQLARVNAQSPDQAKSNDIYLKLSLNPDLAKLAGLKPIDPNTVLSTPSLHATPSPSTQSTMALRPETAPATAAFTPLITPLSSPATLASQQYSISPFSSTLTSILAPSPISSNPTSLPAPPATTTPPPADTTDMETPGMVAAKGDPLSDTPDLNLDSLPDRPDSDRESADAPAQLPQVMNSDQLHLELNNKLEVPGPTNVPKNVASDQLKTPPVAPTAPVQNPATVPVPVVQQPQLTPVHAPIANPFDILNR